MRPFITPQTIHVAITLDDASVVFMAFVTRGEFAGGTKAIAPTPANLEAEIRRYPWGARAVSWRVIDRADVPDDPLTRRYRAAVRDTGAFTFDMPTARAIHRDLLRNARAPLLAALDVESLRASEDNDHVALVNVALRKNVLRDLTADSKIEAAKTLTELNAAWPEVLRGP